MKQEKDTLRQKPGSQLEQFFITTLQELYWSEKLLQTSISKRIKSATTEELQEVLDEHLEVTKGQVARLERVFEIVGVKAHGEKCEPFEALLLEIENGIEKTEEGSMLRDVVIIMTSQKAEHYRIATYGTMIRFARTMGREEAALVLQDILDEVKETDMTLSGVAENNVNVEAY